MLEQPQHIVAIPLISLSVEERVAFESVASGPWWPEVGSRMMTRMLDGQDLADGWVVVQDGICRYAVVQGDGLLVRSVVSEYLATEIHWRH